jgi:hypothetical protein
MFYNQKVKSILPFSGGKQQNKVIQSGQILQQFFEYSNLVRLICFHRISLKISDLLKDYNLVVRCKEMSGD